MKDLQNIKDEVAEEVGYKSNSVFNAYEQLLINPHGHTYLILNESVNQVAIRYAQEQKRELVEMLEECVSVLTWTLENARPDSDWTTFTNSITNAIVESEELITKHKQS